MRSHKAVYGFGLALVYSIVSGGLGLLVTPFLLRHLGEERLGTFRAACDLLGYLVFLELGLGAALSGIFAQSVAHANRDQIFSTIAAGATVYSRLAIAGVLCLLAGAWIVPYLFQASPATLDDLRVGLLLSGVTYATFRFAPFRSLLEARQKSYVVQIVAILAAILGFVLSMTGAVAGWGIAGQCGAATAVVVFTNLALAVAELRSHPEEFWALWKRDAVSPDVYRRLWSLNWSNFAITVAGRVGLHSDNLIIGVVLGPAAVVPFYITQRLIQLAATQTLALGNSTWAALAELHFQNERELLQRRLTEVTGYTMTIGLAGVVTAAIWGRTFVDLWVGERFFGGGTLIAFAATTAITQTLVSLWGWLFAGTGKTRLIVPCVVTASLLNAVLSVAATYLFGLPGPVIGSCAAFFMTYWWWIPRIMRREFQIETRGLATAALKPIVAACFYFLPIMIIADAHPIARFASSRIVALGCLGAVMTLVAIGYLAMCWLFVIPPQQREEWRNRAVGMLPNRKS